MNIWKKKHNHRRSDKDEWIDIVDTITKPACYACHGTKKCHICQGRGCMECDYTGICQDCILEGRRR